ncbi:MAG: pyridoxamine 5'-phosphate oxidase family protein, partial [Candidatus Pacebacteria bacterium]|nr:pyridoxamine 5'-phosphate oxidase family protein [Candidatus Paceibacterota bacterium]
MDKTELKKTVTNFLNNHRKAVFGIIDENGLPATSLMLYVIDDEMNIYFGTRKAFSKYSQIKNTPTVSLSVIEEVLDPLKVVDLRGEAEEVPAEELAEIHTFFKSKNDSKYYVEGAEDFVMFKI